MKEPGVFLPARAFQSVFSDLGVFIGIIYFQGLSQRPPKPVRVGIVENDTALTLFPNPANESVTLVGEDLEEVTLYNIMGQKVDAFFAEGSQLVISTAKYHDGNYFVKTNNGETRRLVIAHE